MMNDAEKAEWLRCAESPIYFVGNYLQIYDSASQAWIPFGLWPAQARTLKTIQENRLTVILKARQLGLTWTVLGYALWSMLMMPIAEVLLFSRRDDEAVYLLDDRLKGMYNRLPDFLRAADVVVSNAHEFGLSNGSTARAFPTSAGDSYTATLAVVDEADLVPDFNRLMRSVKPTIDTGGRMILLSRADKTRPESEFKKIYRAAVDGKSPWVPVFLPWYIRPERDAAWYADQRADSIARTGGDDDLLEQYPATDVEALSPRTLDKRIPGGWLRDCYFPMPPMIDEDAPIIAGLSVFRQPVPLHQYVIGCDPAEGNPTSDDSAIVVLNIQTGEQMAVLHGKFEPSAVADYVAQLSAYYNDATAMIERNNHGHAVILALRDTPVRVLRDPANKKPGWLSNHLGKTTLYNEATATFRDGDAAIHHMTTYNQLAAIEGATLRAPDGQHDDLADAFALALVGRAAALAQTTPMRPSRVGNRPRGRVASATRRR